MGRKRGGPFRSSLGTAVASLLCALRPIWTIESLTHSSPALKGILICMGYLFSLQNIDLIHQYELNLLFTEGGTLRILTEGPPCPCASTLSQTPLPHLGPQRQTFNEPHVEGSVAVTFHKTIPMGQSLPLCVKEDPGALNRLAVTVRLSLPPRLCCPLSPEDSLVSHTET